MSRRLFAKILGRLAAHKTRGSRRRRLAQRSALTQSERLEIRIAASQSLESFLLSAFANATVDAGIQMPADHDVLNSRDGEHAHYAAAEKAGGSAPVNPGPGDGRTQIASYPATEADSPPNSASPAPATFFASSLTLLDLLDPLGAGTLGHASQSAGVAAATAPPPKAPAVSPAPILSTPQSSPGFGGLSSPNSPALGVPPHISRSETTPAATGSISAREVLLPTISPSTFNIDGIVASHPPVAPGYAGYDYRPSGMVDGPTTRLWTMSQHSTNVLTGGLNNGSADGDSIWYTQKSSPSPGFNFAAAPTNGPAGSGYHEVFNQGSVSPWTNSWVTGHVGDPSVVRRWTDTYGGSYEMFFVGTTIPGPGDDASKVNGRLGVAHYVVANGDNSWTSTGANGQTPAEKDYFIDPYVPQTTPPSTVRAGIEVPLAVYGYKPDGTTGTGVTVVYDNEYWEGGAHDDVPVRIKHYVAWFPDSGPTAGAPQIWQNDGSWKDPVNGHNQANGSSFSIHFPTTDGLGDDNLMPTGMAYDTQDSVWYITATKFEVPLLGSGQPNNSDTKFYLFKTITGPNGISASRLNADLSFIQSYTNIDPNNNRNFSANWLRQPGGQLWHEAETNNQYLLFSSGKLSDSTTWEIYQAQLTANPTEWPVYRIYNGNASQHVFTSGRGEYRTQLNAGLSEESLSDASRDFAFFQTSTAPAGSVPVHRLYNPNGGQHYFTTNDVERQNLINAGWTPEGDWGNVYTSAQGAATEVYMLYLNGDHLWTRSQSERDALHSPQWGGWEIQTSLGFAVPIRPVAS